MHPVAVRQILLSVLNTAIHCQATRRILISVQMHNTEVAVRVRYVGRGGSESGADETGLDTAQRIAHLCGCRLHMTTTGEQLESIFLLPALGQVTVLVIDDNLDTLELFQRYLMGTRYRLVGLREPAQAVRVTEEVAPRLIMIDIMMPQIDGWEVMGQLRHHPATGHIPLVVCSIVGQEDLALSLGASGYIQKPVTRQAFLAALARHVPNDEPHCA